MLELTCAEVIQPCFLQLNSQSHNPRDQMVTPWQPKGKMCVLWDTNDDLIHTVCSGFM